MKLSFVWATDIHLDVLESDDEIKKWVSTFKSTEADTILLTGDISTAPEVIRHLRLIRQESEKRILFVLGNHDYWDGSINKLRSQISDVGLANDGIVWLGSSDYVPFGEQTAVVGHDGWYDALNGNFKKSRFVMNDWFRTSEFSGALQNVVETSRALALQGASHVEACATRAIQDGKKRILVMTHFPPFVEACFYRGKRSEEMALPWYSSKTMGNTLLRLSEQHPDVIFTVLCGHTHSQADVSIRPNLRVIVGDADYGSPRFNVIGVSE